MNEDNEIKIFEDKKTQLSESLKDILMNSIFEKSKRDSIIKLLEILNQYCFENRLEKKGLLSHTIIDSLELDYSIGEKFIIFDNSIR